MKRHPAQIIQRKRDGFALDRDEIVDFVDGVVDGGFGDAQLGAMLMAVCCRGMNVEEIADLTLAMRDSGVVLDLSTVDGIKVDKHSTGGVGDKVSLILAPLVAAAGVPVPMISGRGLGHTGGTLDKLAAIPGYRTDVTPDEFVQILADCGFVMSGPSAELAPADQRMYSVRDVSGTVESIPLITSSILSKKLASGLDALVMDVKVGRAAFMPSQEDARQLMTSLVRVGSQAGKKIRALMTDMDVPLGFAVGNSLEVRESIEALRDEGPADLVELVVALGSEMLVLGGVATDTANAEPKLRELLASGAALECFRKNIERQGGDPSVLDDPAVLPFAPVQLPVEARQSGFVADIDPLVIGHAVVQLGGGRRQPADIIDPRVGIVLQKKLSDAVERGEPWAVVHAADETTAKRAAARIAESIRIAATEPPCRPLILERM